MTITSVEVYGWKNAGPVYSVHHYLSGFSNRRNRTPVDEHGVRGGRNTSEAGWLLAATDGDTEYWIVNKGHVYEFVVDIGGEESSHLFDAREAYLVLKFRHPINVVEVSVSTDSEDDVLESDSLKEE